MLATRIGINLGIEHQDIDVAAHREHVIEPAITDVVGPAVPSHQPHTFVHQVVGQLEQLGDLRVVRQPAQEIPQLGNHLSLRRNRCFPVAPGVFHRGHQILRQKRRQLVDQMQGPSFESVDRQSETEAEFGIVLKKRIGPGRSPSVAIRRIRCGGQIAPVDRGTTGGIGDHQAVPEKLRQQLQIGSFAATGAGA